MNARILQIDISNSNNKANDDLIQIKFKNDDILQVNFSKLVSQSKYIRDKYKYSEAINAIPSEIYEIIRKTDMSFESIKYFIQIIQEEKAKFPIKNYVNIYILAEYFCVQALIDELNKISDEELFNDLTFSIQILLDYKPISENYETIMLNRIENLLSHRINECIKNQKFNELPISIIFRIFELCEKEKINQDILIDFIFASAKTRFTLLKFVELHKLSDEKLNELIELIEREDSETRRKCLEFLPFSLLLIKNMRNKFDKLFIENEKIKKESEKRSKELNQAKNDVKCKYDNLLNELNETKIKYDQLNEELDKCKEQLLSQTKNENKQQTQSLFVGGSDALYSQIDENKQQTQPIFVGRSDAAYNQIDENKQQMQPLFASGSDALYNQNDENKQQTLSIFVGGSDEFFQIGENKQQTRYIFASGSDALYNQNDENKQQTLSIFVGGSDELFQIDEKSSNKGVNPIISPPLNFPVDSSSIQSFSVYFLHSVLITNDGSLKGSGINVDGRISATLSKERISHFTDFSIKDSFCRHLIPISAVCTGCGTLYMFRKSDSTTTLRQLVLCDCQINGGTPVFLDIGNHEPLSLFGGNYHSACIGLEGEIIFINRYSVKNSPDSLIEAVFLPEGEKASSVACCDDSVFVLSSNGRVFESPIKDEDGSSLNFSAVSELTPIEIVYLSGTHNHCLAVSKEGQVFGRGSNEYGKLGLGRATESSESFTEIASLRRYKIRAAYAGVAHSLFQTSEGKILACGYNCSGQLLLSRGPGEDVYEPTETAITSGASFCIAGFCLSTVFSGKSIPPNMPNRRIYDYK